MLQPRWRSAAHSSGSGWCDRSRPPARPSVMPFPRFKSDFPTEESIPKPENSTSSTTRSHRTPTHYSSANRGRSGIATIDSFEYLYQSADCTGQAYLSLTGLGGGRSIIAPEIGHISMAPPVTVPTIYFAGQPASVLNIKSGQFPLAAPGTPCQTMGGANGFPIAVGLPQSVPVSDLGLTPPFHVK
jgi:hypothetical protein